MKTLITQNPLAIDNTHFETIEARYNFEVEQPSKVLGGLTPRVPLAEVRSFDFGERCLWQSRGMLSYCYSLMVQICDTLTLIDTQEKFRQIFAPVENEQEAVSYVAFMTQTLPGYDIQRNQRYRIYVSHFPSTYAKKIVGGFEVLLHDKKVYGCGPHPNYYRKYKVTNAGHITLLQTVKMFEDPEEDGICVD